MAYSTGSGTYVDLMNAVLAHAVADGWTTTGGTWPINKGKVRGVAWSTTTRAVTDLTSGNTQARTERLIYLAIGTTPANATANAAIPANSCIIPCMEFAISDWHIYSGPNKNYIHVVTRYSNGVDPEVFNHFSFGLLDTGGLSYSGAAYAISSGRRGYIGSLFTPSYNAPEFACGQMPNWTGYGSGSVGLSLNFSQMTNSYSSALQTMQIILDPDTSPVPVSGTWPQPNALINRTQILDSWSPADAANVVDDLNFGYNAGLITSSSSISYSMSTMAFLFETQVYTGGVTMMPLPIILLNGTSSSAAAMFLGVIPDIRGCSIDRFTPKDSVVYGSETWQLMPLLKKTSFAQMKNPNYVSSGPAGYAYKKVV